ncbi:MAG: methylenetetrahydrofolate reductase [Clostridia bacterium]|nr:methylenetetrahydrofolate reductase [NAD(P)H] [Clostridia bacterium]
MRISELLARDGVTFSLEVFPPKTSDKYTETAEAAMEIARLGPDFMSVTYGAGGGTGDFTAGIAAGIQREYGVPTLAHLTCVSSDRAHVMKMLEVYRENGIENILALRGDVPQGGQVSTDYRYAVELIRDIRENGDFCIGGACYPEGHIESANKREDLKYLKEKTDAGLDFLTTQMFFNNDIFYNFLYRAREAGINIPVIAGIMPITNAKMLKRSVAMSGTDVPQRFRAIVDFFGTDPAAMKQAGIVYASEQIIDLIANGIRHIHVYTMNKPDVAEGIMKNLSSILHLSGVRYED